MIDVKIYDKTLRQNLTDAVDEWVAEQCGCGLDSKGEWSERLFEACGCDCREHFDLPIFVHTITKNLTENFK